MSKTTSFTKPEGVYVWPELNGKTEKSPGSIVTGSACLTMCAVSTLVVVVVLV
jgi:hypothetical protein